MDLWIRKEYLLDTAQQLNTQELIAVATADTNPPHTQTRPNHNMEWGFGHEASPLAISN